MRIAYWISTGLVAAFVLVSALTYFLHQGTIDGIRALGFPGFFRIQLGVLKLVAVIIILAPHVPSYVKEWAYAGVGLFLLTAIVAHSAHGDPIVLSLISVVFLFALAVSNVTGRRLRHPSGANGSSPAEGR